MTQLQIIAALDECIDRLKQARAVLAPAPNHNPPPSRRTGKSKHRRAAESSRWSEGQKKRWAKIRAQAAAPTPQVSVTRVRAHSAPQRYGPRPRQREKTALTASIPAGPIAFNRPGGAPLVHRPFAELEKLLKQAS